jgi:hypothetical protein
VIFSTSRGMHGGKREDGIVKYDIAGNIDSTSGSIEIFEALVHVAVLEKDATSGAELQLVGVIWT